MNKPLDMISVKRVTRALGQLEEVASGRRKLVQDDQSWLTELGKSLPLESLPLPITVGELLAASDDNHEQYQLTLKKLQSSLRAMLSATTHTPVLLNDLPVHNADVAHHMRPSYTAQSFSELFNFCQSKQVFALSVNDQNGLVRTAEAEENWDMSGRQWVTDTVRCGDMERALKPSAWRQAMVTLCRFYNQNEEMEAMEHSIANPAYYREGGLLDGVAHIFLPETLKRDATWFNNKRLESHGLALKAICDTASANYPESTEASFTAAEISEHSDLLADTIVMVASYLKAINSNGETFDFGAPSAGPWEEIPFPEGLTWDSEAIRSGFESLQNLLASKSGVLEPLLKKIQQHRHGQWLADKDKTLAELLKAGRTKILDRLFSGPSPVENPHRPMDSSLAFITTSTLKMHEHPVEDVRMQYRLLAVIEQMLVRDHGIIRYAPFNLPLENGQSEQVFDSYLADNYWLMPELRAAISGHSSHLKDYGSSDCSTNEDYLARVKQARPGTEAQWCFVSVLAEGYSRQVAKLLAMKKKGFNEQELTGLINQGHLQATKMINRAYARITPGGSNMANFKANGMPCPEFAIPEAYEMVSKLNFGITQSDAAELSAIAGANTPLAWGQASLYSASTIFLNNLRTLES